MTDLDRIDGPRPVRQGEELDLRALDTWLSAHVPGLGDGELVVEQFPSGYSNLTYLVKKGATELVLRRPPFAVQVKSGHDMAREHRVLSALAPAYPLAPRPLAYCDDADVIGAPFYVMERRRGIIVRRTLPSGVLGEPSQVRAMFFALIDGLADLHAIDVHAVGLSDLGQPDGYARRQVEGWIARYEKAKTEDVAEIDELATWLRARIPAVADATLVHNDYKLDNVVLDPGDPTRIIAVLDWEMCTLGDPLMDLGTTLGYWVQADDDPHWRAMAFGPTMEPGAPTRAELAQRYADRTGRDISNMLFYYAFGLLKIAGIVQQIYYRYKKGHTSDPRFARLNESVRMLGAVALHAIARGAG